MKSRLKIIICLLTLTGGCEFYDLRLRVKNDFDKPVCVEIVSNDLSYIKQVNDAQYYINAKIDPQEIRSFSKSGKEGWEYFIEKTNDKKLNILVFDLDTLVKYENMFLLLEMKKYKVFSYRKDELEKMNWEIGIKEEYSK